MGSQLLSVLHPDELFQILLHEFAHLANESEVTKFGDGFAYRFMCTNSGSYADFLLNSMLAFPGYLAASEYETCRLASSEQAEKRADA